MLSLAPRRWRDRLNLPAVEESSTRAARPRRVVDLVAVVMEGSSTTSTAPPAQHLVELYGLLPTVADDVDLMSFPSKVCFAATGRELACPMDHMGRA